MVCKYFFHFCRLSFYFLDIVLGSTVFNFDEVQFILFSLVVCAFGVVKSQGLVEKLRGV